MHHKIVFTSDIHGNEVQYIKLRDYAIRTGADSVIIGGDIAPKYFSDRGLINGQRHFLDKRLPNLLRPIKEKSPKSRIFLMMGNDDCATNLGILERNDPDLFHVIHGKRISLTDEYDIVGYSFVPITPFGIKDWEKYDLSNVPECLCSRYKNRKATNYQLSGYKTRSLHFERFVFTPEIEEIDSIQKDLSNELFVRDANKTVYVFHSPPDDTSLDVGYAQSLGSIAIRLFIEKYQPYLTLHGHIHETVSRSGKYLQKIGKSVCLAAGNDDLDSRLSVLLLDSYNPQNAERVVV